LSSLMCVSRMALAMRTAIEQKMAKRNRNVYALMESLKIRGSKKLMDLR
jgi:hypothetical protein